MENVVLKFPKPLAPCSINLVIENSSNAAILGVSISTYSATFPAVWKNFGEISGGANLLSLEGIGTQVITARFSNFIHSETVQFNGLSVDLAGRLVNYMCNRMLAGSKAILLLSNGTMLYSELSLDDQGDISAEFN